MAEKTERRIMQTQEFQSRDTVRERKQTFSQTYRELMRQHIHCEGRAPKRKAETQYKGTDRAGAENVSQRRRAAFLIKAGICAAICLAVVLVRMADTPAAQEITGGIRTVLTYSIEIDETLGKLKFVDSTQPQIREVFAAADAMDVPVSGAIAGDFSQTQQGLLFAQTRDNAVIAAAEGTVLETGYGEEHGNYVIVQHEDGLETYYGGLQRTLVSQGTRVKRGQELGIAEETLLFAVRSDGKAVDPVQYLQSAY